MEMTFDEWVEKYKPNCFGEDVIVYETYGKSLSFIQKQPNNHIWTLLSDGEVTCIVSGFRYTNRLGYIFSNNALENDDDSFIELTDEDLDKLGYTI